MMPWNPEGAAQVPITLAVQDHAARAPAASRYWRYARQPSSLGDPRPKWHKVLGSVAACSAAIGDTALRSRSAEIQGARVRGAGRCDLAGAHSRELPPDPISSDAKALDGLDVCDEIASHQTSEMYGWAAEGYLEITPGTRPIPMRSKPISARFAAAASDTILAVGTNVAAAVGGGCANA